MLFAIRDDDTCYFTQPEELERVYARLPGFAVSLAVTPFALKSEHLGDPLLFRQSGPPRPIHANPTLVNYLRQETARRRYSILCHGFTHEYERRGEHLIQECLWKDAARLRVETADGRAYLEQLLGVPVDGYVPPGNSISRAGIEAVGASISRILATLPLRRANEFLWNSGGRRLWLTRVIDQLRFCGPGLFPYTLAGVQLLACTSWTSIADWEITLARLELAHRLGANFTVAVHYWELKGKVLDGLLHLADRAHTLGFQSAHCTELFPTLATAASTAEPAGAEKRGKQNRWAASKIS